QRVRADDLEAVLGSVDERGATAVSALDHVRRGEHEAVGRDHHSAAPAVEYASAANAPRDPQVGDRGGQALGDRGHGSRVGVERLVLARSLELGADEPELRHSPKLATSASLAMPTTRNRNTHRLAAMPEVETSRDGAVLTVTLNRPDVLNALNAATHKALGVAFKEARSEEVRAVVLTGAGRGFCVGQDLSEFKEGGGDIGARLRGNYHPTINAIRSLEKPVIAAVNGAAAGAGLSLACAC